MILLAVALATAAPSEPVYAVVRIGAALDDGERVGERRAGMLCLPGAAIRWSDLASPANIEQRETVQDVLEDEGLPVTPLGETASGRRVLRLRGTVQAAQLKLCARNGLDAKALSGTPG